MTKWKKDLDSARDCQDCSEPFRGFLKKKGGGETTTRRFECTN